MAVAVLVLSLLVTASGRQHLDAASDHVAIRQALLDYAEGFYDHAPDRMTRAVAPVLTKRALMVRPGGASVLVQMNAEMLIEAAGGAGPRPTAADRQLVVEVLDVSGNIASARVFSVQFNDYVHLIKRNRRWTLLNVLWHPPLATPVDRGDDAVSRAASEYAAAMSGNDGAALVAVTCPVAVLRTLSASHVVVDRNVESTAAAIAARTTPRGAAPPVVTVLGSDGDIASVKIGTGPVPTYLHLAWQHGKWLVVNALTAVSAPLASDGPDTVE